MMEKRPIEQLTKTARRMTKQQQKKERLTKIAKKAIKTH